MVNKEYFEQLLVKEGIHFVIDRELKDYTTLKIGGPAWYILEVCTKDEINKIIEFAKRCNIPYTVLGNGSNILVMDKGYDGAVIVLSRKYKKIVVENNFIRCEAGANLMDVCEVARDAHLTGMEFAYGIPGTVGGAVYMNAGAFDGEIKDIVKEASYIDEAGNQFKLLLKSEDFSYRTSIFTGKTHCITEVIFELKGGNIEEIYNKMIDIYYRRVQKQPLDYPNAGSFFKRPVGNYASALIDQCGLKGKSYGGAMVSMKHAGFLINVDHATSEDFLNLANQVIQIVHAQTGIELEKEIKILS